MFDRHFVVPLEGRRIGRILALAIGFENRADASHAKGMQLSRAQRAHAGGAEDMHALAQGKKDLAMPYRRNLMEITIDKPDYVRTMIAHQAIDIALPRGGQVNGVQHAPGLGGWHCGP